MALGGGLRKKEGGALGGGLRENEEGEDNEGLLLENFSVVDGDKEDKEGACESLLIGKGVFSALCYCRRKGYLGDPSNGAGDQDKDAAPGGAEDEKDEDAVGESLLIGKGVFGALCYCKRKGYLGDVINSPRQCTDNGNSDKVLEQSMQRKEED